VVGIKGLTSFSGYISLHWKCLKGVKKMTISKTLGSWIDVIDKFEELENRVKALEGERGAEIEEVFMLSKKELLKLVESVMESILFDRSEIAQYIDDFCERIDKLSEE
jgi:hypothetical protein